MATAVSIAIRKADAQARIQQASIELAAKYGVEGGDLAPFHKQPDIQTVLTLEAIASFLETLVTAAPVPVAKRKTEKA
jgi:hypothetical protein